MSNEYLMLPTYAEKHRSALEAMSPERRKFVLESMERVHCIRICSTGIVHNDGTVTIIDKNGNRQTFAVDD